VKLARFRKPKATLSLHRSNTNISNIIKNRSHYRKVTNGRGRVKKKKVKEESKGGEYG
jgi:hypothetical protein